MSPEDWKKLIEAEEGSDEYNKLIEATMLETEHPENYEGPCSCQLCMSYGD